MEKFVTVRNLNYQDILKNINLDIEKNSFVAISGANKCGKTTLIKLLSGFLNNGETITIEKKDLNSLSKIEMDKKIGHVIPSIEQPFIFETIEQELQFILGSVEMNQESKKEWYKNIVSIFKLRSHTAKDPSKLYLFLKVKVLLALAVIKKPKLLLLDDICSMLEKEETKEILDILKKLNKEQKITIVMTTGNLDEVIGADYLYILDKGEVVLEGEPFKVFQEDSMLAKMGLSLPFMVDLSLKLKYYDLLEKIELDMDRMVNTLWK